MPKLTEPELQAKAADEARAARVLRDTPEVPPGVRTFDPRRIRRRERVRHMARTNRELSEKLAQANIARKALAGLLGVKDQEIRNRTIWFLVKAALRRLRFW